MNSKLHSHDYSVVKETLYDRIWFRSRLEARWAMFFDMIGVYWLYEQERFKLDGGIVYTPDFYLPDQELHVEIKPEEPTRNEVDKAQALSRRLLPCAILCGKPSLATKAYFFGNDEVEGSGGELEARGVLDLLPLHKGMSPFLSIYLDEMNRPNRRIVRCDGIEITHYRAMHDWVDHTRKHSGTSRSIYVQLLATAMQEAASHRF